MTRTSYSSELSALTFCGLYEIELAHRLCVWANSVTIIIVWQWFLFFRKFMISAHATVFIFPCDWVTYTLCTSLYNGCCIPSRLTYSQHMKRAIPNIFGWTIHNTDVSQIKVGVPVTKKAEGDMIFMIHTRLLHYELKMVRFLTAAQVAAFRRRRRLISQCLRERVSTQITQNSFWSHQ